jgi:osmotically-inducible protein OsmY
VEPAINAAEIGVTVADGVVTLTGHVDTLREKWTAEKVARHVWGVRAIANDIGVTPEGISRHSDPAIAHAAANALEWDSSIPPELVKATVREGWVTLTGTVPRQFQKAAAEHAVQHVYGVKGVANSITVKPAAAENIREHIEEAFRHDAQIDADRIAVATCDGTVTLTGSVRSLAERDAVEDATWAVPGVTRVDDRIVVTGRSAL